MSAPHRPKIVYLVTSSLSSLLLRGQLDFVASHGFDVVVGTGVDPMHEAKFDESAKVVDLGYQRNIAPLKDLSSLIRTVRLLRSERPDIVNFSTPKAALLGGIGAWLLRVPTRVYVVRGLRYETATGWGRRALQGLERILMWGSTDVIFNSQSLVNTVVKDGLISASRCAVLAGGSGNGIDTIGRGTTTRQAARQDLDLPHDAAILGFVGRLTRDKGIVDLAKAFQGLLDDYPHLLLLLVGEYEEGDAVPEETQEFLQSCSAVRHLGWVSDPSTAYAAMNLFVFPSYREGLPNAVLEAQLARLPVVGYAATGTVDAVGHGETGFLVPVGRTDELEAVLREFIDDPARAQRVGAAGYDFVQRNFERSKIWTELADLYRRRILDWS